MPPTKMYNVCIARTLYLKRLIKLADYVEL